MKCYGGAPGQPGRFSFFPKGALTHHLVVAKSACFRFRQTAKTASAPLLLLSPQSLLLCGDPLRRWQSSRWSGSCALHEVPFSRFSRGGRQCRKRTLPVQLAAMFFLNIKTVVKQPANCLRKPATGSFVADMGIASPATPIFFLRKRNKNEGKVRTNGNLPFGSKSGQPGQWAFCCCRFCLFELFQDVE